LKSQYKRAATAKATTTTIATMESAVTRFLAYRALTNKSSGGAVIEPRGSDDDYGRLSINTTMKGRWAFAHTTPPGFARSRDHRLVGESCAAQQATEPRGEPLRVQASLGRPGVRGNQNVDAGLTAGFLMLGLALSLFFWG
jgi:hypothetical protein